MRLVRVLADDLTGACDVAGELLALGRPVRIRSATGESLSASDPDALWVANTQSRACDVAEAARRVRMAVGPGPLGGDEVALKKIDTALRGHVAAEVAAAMEALRPGLVLVAPAIPEVGRTTEGGWQLIDGVPVSETAFGRDPVNPVRDASVVATIGSLPDVAVHPVPLAIVRDDVRYVAFVREALAGRLAVLVADAATDTDLAHSVSAVTRAGVPVLVVGSIGVARALAAVVPSDGGGGARDGSEVRTSGRGVLVACGSRHPVAQGQLVALECRWGIPPCEVGADPEASGRLAGAVVAASGLGVLTLRAGAADPNALGAAIGRAAHAAVEQHRPRGLVLIGGETAYHCLRALDDPLLEVEARPMPLVVRARVVTGPWAGMRVLSKGGSAGDENAVTEMIALAEDGAWERDDR